MKRITHPIVALCFGGLLALTLVLAASAQSPSRPDSTIKVPDDYPTIQLAIDAADEGDTILVAEGNYLENLSITEAITLSGGWDFTFSIRQPGDSRIDGQGLGRVISITCASSDEVVVIDGFTIRNGDASGLGGPHLAPEGAFASPARRQALPKSDALTPAQIRARLSDAAARGLYPGGAAAFGNMLARLERLENLAEGARARFTSPTGEASSQPAIDCGGGVYSWNASLHLLNNYIQKNLASSVGAGYGGGVCVRQSAEGGVLIADNLVDSNVGSLATGDMMNGRGGGIYLFQAPGAVIEDNLFTGNVANQAGFSSSGLGGGLMVDESPGVVVQRNRMERNVASVAWEADHGLGGGAYFRFIDNGVISHNDFNDNQAALRGRGGGGGMYLFQSYYVQITDNSMVENWACLYQATGDVNGGGLGVDTVYSATIRGNLIRENIAAPYGMYVSYGGGFYGYNWEDSVLVSNTITGNLTSPGAHGVGGGGYLEGSEEAAISDNDFANNVAGLENGYGGGLYMRGNSGSLVQRNRFQGNLGSLEGQGKGGALYVVRWPLSYDTTVDGNLFLNNQASADSTASSSTGGACFISTNDFTFANNLLAGNFAPRGSGLAVEASTNGVATNNTLAGNDDTAILIDQGGVVALTNNIVVSHTVGVTVSEGSTATVSYTLWYGNGADTAGEGTINHTHPVTGAPAFFDPAQDNYRLTASSAALDAGDPAGVPPAPDHDADGAPRPQGPRVDLGAYEWQGYRNYFPVAFNRGNRGVGWAVGERIDGYGAILHTVDGGATWTRQGSPAEVPDTDLQEVSAVDALNAWVVGRQVILRTHDGGQTWEIQTLPPGLPAGFELYGIKALDAAHVYVVGNPTVLLYTANGADWSQMPVGAGVLGNIDFQTVDAVDASHVWAVGGTMVGDNRTDPIMAFYNGIQWQVQPTVEFTDPGTNAFIGVSAIDALHVWAVGGWGMPLVTTSNGGLTWQATDHPLSPGDMNRVVAVSPTTGWTSGDYGSVLYTTDAGANWFNTNIPSAFLFGITAMDGQTAWVVGPSVHTYPPGIIARTLDGVNWTTLSDPSWPNLRGISFVGARR